MAEYVICGLISGVLAAFHLFASPRMLTWSNRWMYRGNDLEAGELMVIYCRVLGAVFAIIMLVCIIAIVVTLAH